VGEGSQGKVCMSLQLEGLGANSWLVGRLDVRTKAMEGMPALIEKWRKLGHGRGWKEWPKKREKGK
jgi:large subunit ribosomal protein L25